QLAIYQADYAAAHIARFLIEFIERGVKERDEKKEPWRYYSVRLSTALEEMKNHSRLTDSQDYVAKVVDRARPLVDGFEKGSTLTPADFNVWLGQNPPNST